MLIQLTGALAEDWSCLLDSFFFMQLRGSMTDIHLMERLKRNVGASTL
ncbi:hypothetical protein [Peribacillus frigoritolerans]|nr:hypothetical protein [Peribacillus frigoritolerans]